MRDSILKIGQEVYVYKGGMKPYKTKIITKCTDIPNTYYVHPKDIMSIKKMIIRYDLYVIPDEIDNLYETLLDDLDSLQSIIKYFEKELLND
ncbi:MAG: hypothetical protein GY870_14610 [archaeon]|nr:hypothetical protein [archaeon]